MTVDAIDSIKSGDVPLLVIEKGTQPVDEVNTSAVSSAGVMWAAVPAYSLTPAFWHHETAYECKYVTRFYKLLEIPTYMPTRAALDMKLKRDLGLLDRDP